MKMLLKDEAMMVLGKMRTFNAEPVIRCRECEYRDCGKNEVDSWDRCKLHMIDVGPDEYCSWALERKKE